MFGPPFHFARGVRAPSMGEAWRVSELQGANPGGTGPGYSGSQACGAVLFPGVGSPTVVG